MLSNHSLEGHGERRNTIRDRVEGAVINRIRSRIDN